MRLRLIITLCLSLFALCQPAEACGRWRRSCQPAPQTFTWAVQSQASQVQTFTPFTPSPQPSAYITIPQVQNCPGGNCPAPVLRR
jgi:hypothetical protein